MNAQENKGHFSSKILVKTLLVGLPLAGAGLLILFLFSNVGFSWPVFVAISSLFFSPIVIIYLYLLFRLLIPITGGMPTKGFRRWILLYPFFVGFFLFWAFLSFVIEYFAPFLPREDRQITLPLLIIAVTSVILFTTRLRLPVTRFLIRIVGNDPQEESDQGYR